jgi:3-deoxy-manno-octulosonate cytidylyltransferase (CMP-KDO synthetase)
MEFYVVIPARFDSSRFPGKVLSKIGGKSMLEHVFLNAKKSNAKEVYIATDSKAVYEEARKFTDTVIITSNLNKNGTERVAELAKSFKWGKKTLVINVQADMPQLKHDNIDYLAKVAKGNEGLSTLYYPLNSDTLLTDKNTVKIMINNGVISFHREINNYESEEIYKHIGIYAYYVKDLLIYLKYPQSVNEKSLSLEQYRFLDNNFNISPYLAVSDPGISVDSIDNINDINGVNI